MNVLVEDLKSVQNGSQNALSFLVSSESKQNLLKNINSIESSYNIELEAIKGIYTFKITSNMITSIIVIFAKK